jgi:vang-like
MDTKIKSFNNRLNQNAKNRIGQKHKSFVGSCIKDKRLLDNVEMAPFQTAVSMRQDSVDSLGQDAIDVQILPGEDNWAENTTAMTGNTSERSESIDGIDEWSNDERSFDKNCNRYFGLIYTFFIITSAFLTPLVMIILPKLGLFSDTFSMLTVQQKLMYSSCNIECKGHLLGLIFKIALLGIGTWAIFWRSRKVYVPRLFMFQAGVIVLTTFCICTFWLFYIVQITEEAKTAIVGDLAEYKSLVNYAGNLVDTLLFIHYTAVILVEIRHLKPMYYLKVIRSPDGTSRSYAVGQLSIQRAAVWILEKYYTEFPIYNPYLERLPVSKSNKKHLSNFKFYDVDNAISNNDDQHTRSGGSDRAILAAQARRRDSSHNERFYEEHEYERRVRKRKARLITATEEAFSHIQRVNSDVELVANSTPLDPMEAAQSVFPSMARALQKYLRITRQQPRHSIESILKRLAYCLTQDATPRVFLEPFFNTSPILSNEKEKQRNCHHWALVCEGELPSRPISNGCEFQLRHGEVALLCTVEQLPHLYLTEQIALPKSNRFILKVNSENSN